MRPRMTNPGANADMSPSTCTESTHTGAARAGVIVRLFAGLTAGLQTSTIGVMAQDKMPHSSAFPGRRRSMRLLAAFACGLIAASAAVPAAADTFSRGFGPYIQGQGLGQGQGQGQGQSQGQGLTPRRGSDRAMPQRDSRGADESDRGRMSPEERRQLRQDIQDAGKDIYRSPRQGRGDPRRSGRR